MWLSLARALRSGRRDRAFKSRHPDHFLRTRRHDGSFFVYQVCRVYPIVIGAYLPCNTATPKTLLCALSKSPCFLYSKGTRIGGLKSLTVPNQVPALFRSDMKWFTHKAVAVAGALAAGAHMGEMVAVLVGSVLPDLIDTTVAHGNKKIWRRIHRQTSHWFGWYILLILLGAAFHLQDINIELLHTANITFPGISRDTLRTISAYGNTLIIWIGVGALIHVLLDALTPMRVPIFPFNGRRRFGISLISTGTWQECVFLVAAVGAIALQFDKARDILEAVLHEIF